MHGRVCVYGFFASFYLWDDPRIWWWQRNIFQAKSNYSIDATLKLIWKLCNIVKFSSMENYVRSKKTQAIKITVFSHYEGSSNWVLKYMANTHTHTHTLLYTWIHWLFNSLANRHPLFHGVNLLMKWQQHKTFVFKKFKTIYLARSRTFFLFLTLAHYLITFPPESLFNAFFLLAKWSFAFWAVELCFSVVTVICKTRCTLKKIFGLIFSLKEHYQINRALLEWRLVEKSITLYFLYSLPIYSCAYCTHFTVWQTQIKKNLLFA